MTPSAGSSLTTLLRVADSRAGSRLSSAFPPVAPRGDDLDLGPEAAYDGLVRRAVTPGGRLLVVQTDDATSRCSGEPARRPWRRSAG